MRNVLTLIAGSSDSILDAAVFSAVSGALVEAGAQIGPPIWLTPDLRIMLSLETSYQETCRVLGIA